MEKVWLVNAFKVKPEAAAELLRVIKKGRWTEETKWADDIVEDLEDSLKEEIVPAFFFYNSRLESLLNWAAKAAKPGEVLTFIMEPWDNVPFFGYQVVGDGTLKPLKGALIDEQGQVVETLDF